MASKLSDDLGHPCPVIPAFADHDAVVHYLKALAIADDHVPGLGHFGDRVSVAHSDRERNTAANGLGQPGQL